MIPTRLTVSSVDGACIAYATAFAASEIVRVMNPN